MGIRGSLRVATVVAENSYMKIYQRMSMNKELF